MVDTVGIGDKMSGRENDWVWVLNGLNVGAVFFCDDIERSGCENKVVRSVLQAFRCGLLKTKSETGFGITH